MSENGHGGVNSSGDFRRMKKSGQNSILSKNRFLRIPDLKMHANGSLRSLRGLNRHFYTGHLPKVPKLTLYFARVEAKSKMTKVAHLT